MSLCRGGTDPTQLTDQRLRLKMPHMNQESVKTLRYVHCGTFWGEQGRNQAGRKWFVWPEKMGAGGLVFIVVTGWAWACMFEIHVGAKEGAGFFFLISLPRCGANGGGSWKLPAIRHQTFLVMLVQTSLPAPPITDGLIHITNPNAIYSSWFFLWSSSGWSGITVSRLRLLCQLHLCSYLLDTIKRLFLLIVNNIFFDAYDIFFCLQSLYDIKVATLACLASNCSLYFFLFIFSPLTCIFPLE